MVRTRRQVLTPARLVKPLLMVFAIFYLTFHVLHGERGLYALWRDQRELQTTQTELAKVRSEREQLELRVSHLRDNSLDLDLLDEQMRRMLGVMKPGEVVLMNPAQG